MIPDIRPRTRTEQRSSLPTGRFRRSAQRPWHPQQAFIATGQCAQSAPTPVFPSPAGNPREADLLLLRSRPGPCPDPSGESLSNLLVSGQPGWGVAAGVAGWRGKVSGEAGISAVSKLRLEWMCRPLEKFRAHSRGGPISFRIMPRVLWNLPSCCQLHHGK